MQEEQRSTWLFLKPADTAMSRCLNLRLFIPAIFLLSIKFCSSSCSENPEYSPEKICLGVAGPVFEGRVTVTNLPWHVDANEIAAATGISQVILLNDLEATAYGVAGLDEKDLNSVLHEGDPEEAGNISILAPGTGLGEAGLFWDGRTFHHPFATEGGHCDFSCRNDDDSGTA